MKMRLVLKIFILVLTKSVCFGQIGTCDTAYSTYTGKEQEIRELAKGIKHFNFSADTKQNLEVAFEQSDFGRLEEIIYPVLVERWCNDTYQLSKLILNLDIPNLNSLVIIYSFKNYYPLEADKISSFCYFQDRMISIKNAKDIEFLKSADNIDVWNAWKCIYLSQVIGNKVLNLPYLNDFKKSENSFVRLTYAQIMYKFGQSKKAQSTVVEIISEEIENLEKKNTETIHYVYTPWSVELLLKINSQKGNKQYKKLKKLYQTILIDSRSQENTGHLANLQRVISVMDEIKEEKKCP